MKKLFVRFGEIPKNEQSSIFKNGEIIGKEIGVSCYHAIIDDNIVSIKLNIKNMRDTCVYWLSDETICNNKPVYLILAEEVGLGHSSEPVVKNIKIISELKQIHNNLVIT